MGYTIKWGDTLSSLASRFGTTVSDLINKNPGISNKNLIITGNSLNVGGAGGSGGGVGGDSFGGSAGSGVGGNTALGGTPVGSLPGGASAPFDIARALLGNTTESLKYSGPLAGLLDSSVNNHVCCANFVSACLQKAGWIPGSEHNNSVAGLAANLRNDPNFKSVDLSNAKPGDVVCFNVPGEGSFSHVEMFAGWQNGRPVFIGSNNVNADGSQSVSMGPANYPIAAIFQHV